MARPEDDTTHFGFETRAARRQAGARRRGLPLRRPALRPHERPHVGGPAPRLEGCARHGRSRRRRTRPFRHLDVAGGTGDVAFRIARAGRRRRRSVTVARHQRRHAGGRPRARAERALRRRIDFVEANAEALPLPRRQRSTRYTIAFGIRNVPRIDAALAEALPRAEAGRALPLPRVLQGRRAGARRALRRLFLQRHPAPRASRWPATPRPTATSSNRSAASRRPPLSRG